MFFTWSISEAWDWFIHIPVLGFICVAVMAVLAAAAAAGFRAWLQANG